MKTIKAAPQKGHRRDPELTKAVADIIAAVADQGEGALLALTGRFDQVKLESVKVDPEGIRRARESVSGETLEQLRFAASRIRDFAERQLGCLKPLQYTGSIPGVELGHRLIPVNRCGCYVPGGRYPLPSSALMSIVTAKAAGVPWVAACSPPSAEYGTIHPVTLAAMDIAGADAVYCMGGAQGIAAFAYGAGPVEPVDLIVGPGNRYVTEAKRQVLGDVGIDGLAGPSEVTIIADGTANPVFIAIDLLAQAEHDPDAKAVLICTDMGVITGTQGELDRLAAELPTGKTARESWLANGAVFLAESLEEAAALTNKIAPEHLEIQVAPRAERALVDLLRNYGSLFVGPYAPVALGDFVSGTNHILPTMATARFSNGLWAGTFIKVPFHQFVSEEGCRNLAAPCMYFAGLEGLYAHRDSVRLRVEKSL
jgi:histidinol dehydrogenase/sulfopropanediol 3-dehydrogenase